MRTLSLLAAITLGIVVPGRTPDPTLTRMPPALETRFALSALPPALRARGTGPAALYDEMMRRFAKGIYRSPERAGVSYMLAPVQRTVGPPRLQVVTVALPHVMYYAPNLTYANIGARPDLADPSTLRYPFIDKQGHPAQSYMIDMMGTAEKAQILADEAPLLRDLCAYRDVLCLPKAR
jgi:hypothetical protein